MAVTYPQLTNEEMLDFVRAVYPKVIKKDFSVLCQQYRDYTVADWFASGRVKEKGGSRLTWPVVYKRGASAKHANWTDPDTTSTNNVTAQGYSQWVHFTYNYSWFHQELLMATDEGEILDLMGARRVTEQLNALDVLEGGLWGAPTSPTDGQNTPQGIPFWVQKRSSSATLNGSWDGRDPAGFTDGAGGMSYATIPESANYAAEYTVVSDDDLVRKLREAILRMRFRKPKMLTTDLPAEGFPNPHIYTTLEMKLDLVDLAKENNESLGWDLGKGDAETTFYKHPFDDVDFLAADTDNPIYLIDLDTIVPYVLRGDRFRETGPKMSDDKHNVYAVYEDLTYQYACPNRRKNAVLSLAS